MSALTSERHLWIWYFPLALGGVETFLLRLGRELLQRDVAINVACVKTWGGPLEPLYRSSHVPVLDWTGFNRAFMRQAASGPACAELIDAVANFRPTVVAVNGCSDFGIGAATLLRRLRPFATVLDTFHIDPPDDRFYALRGPYLECLDGVTGVSRRALERLGEFYPRAQVPVAYVPYGVPAPTARRRPMGDELRLLYSGRLIQEQKRVLELPRVVSRLAASGRAWRLSIAGDGPCRAPLEEAFAAQGLLANVRFLGTLSPDDLAATYLEHDLLLNVSTYEGFSISVLEALAAGCVPVCTDLEGRDRSVLVDGVTCRLVPVNELDRMAAILANVDRPEIERLSDGARQEGMRFTISQMVDQYLELIERLRSRRPIREWPADARSVLGTAWDPSRRNPWLPNPHPLRRWAGSAYRLLRGLRGTPVNRTS